MFRRHPLLSVMTVGYLICLGWLTLTPTSSGDRAFSLLGRLVDLFQRHESTSWLSYSLAEFAANVVLFVPMGVFVVLLFGRRNWWAGIFVGALASCWIELAQGVWLPDRVADPRDLASNSIGAALGVILALLLTLPAARRGRAIAAARSASQAGA